MQYDMQKMENKCTLKRSYTSSLIQESQREPTQAQKQKLRLPAMPYGLFNFRPFSYNYKIISTMVRSRKF